MLYSELITILRRETRDYAIPGHDYATGNGIKKAFELTEKPILEGSYTIKQGGVEVIETTDYTFDKESGWVTFTSAVPSGTGVTADYKHVNATDTGWLQIINDTISDLDSYGYFKTETVDTTTYDTIADDIDYVMPTTCKQLVNVWYRHTDSSTANWYELSELVNWRYNRQSNTLYLGASVTAGYPLKIQYLDKYTLGTATTDTIDLQDQYINILKLGSLARYYEHMIGTKMNIETKISKEVTVTPMQNIQALVNHYEKRYESAKIRSKPMMPLYVTHPSVRGGGTA